MNISATIVSYSNGIKKCNVDNWWVNCESTYNTPFWTIQNSWGTEWGLKGYARFEIADGKGVACMNCDPSYPTLA